MLQVLNLPLDLGKSLKKKLSNLKLIIIFKRYLICQILQLRVKLYQSIFHFLPYTIILFQYTLGKQAGYNVLAKIS